jgi:hypothetical protein
MRKKMREEEKKSKVSITINRDIINIVQELHTNKSKYIEWLIYQDLRKNNQIDDIML